MKDRLFDKDFLKRFVLDNISRLTKEELFSIYNDISTAPPKRVDKDMLIKDVLCKYRTEEIYNKCKGFAFGVFPGDLERYLKIDKRIRLKMQKDGFIQIAYKKTFRAYGTYIDTPFYLLEPLLSMTNTDIQRYIDENTKPKNKQTKK